jgi:predicted enzyme related to lactoylglutathione lyase
VIAVEDVKRSIAKVTASGGKVLGDPMEIPSVGQ